MGCYILVGKDKDGNNFVYIGEIELLYICLV